MRAILKRSLSLFLTVALMASLAICAVPSAFASDPAASAVMVYEKTPQMNHSKRTLTVGEKSQLKVCYTTKKPTWRSSNKSVATVSSTGLVTAKKLGSCKIYAKIGSKTYTCSVTVKADYKIVYAGKLSGTYNYSYNFGLADVDKNGVPELFVRSTGGIMGRGTIEVYTMKDGAYYKCGMYTGAIDGKTRYNPTYRCCVECSSGSGGSTPAYFTEKAAYKLTSSMALKEMTFKTVYYTSSKVISMHSVTPANIKKYVK